MDAVEGLAPIQRKQVGCEENFYGYLPTTPAKTTKKPCNKLFASVLKRLVGQRRLVQIYLPDAWDRAFMPALWKRGQVRKQDAEECVSGENDLRVKLLKDGQ